MKEATKLINFETNDPDDPGDIVTVYPKSDYGRGLSIELEKLLANRAKFRVEFFTTEEGDG